MSEFQVGEENLARKDQLANAAIAGLVKTYELHQKLGDSGRTDFQQNQFGETALVMDVGLYWVYWGRSSESLPHQSKNGVF